MTEGARGVDHWQEGPTASRPTYLLIQVLRAVAALMVVAHHATIMLWQRNGLPIGNWIQGAAGVDIFFVISGFVMTISAVPLRGTAHPARTFLARRIERIVPLYWLVTAAKVLVLVAVPTLAVNALGGPGHVVASFLFWPSLSPQNTVEPVVVVGWTLNFEVMFYALFAVALAFRGSVLKVLAPILLAIGLLRLVVQPSVGFPLGWYENTLVLEFLSGILLASFLPWVRKLPATLAVLLVLCGFYFLTSMVWPNFSFWRGLGWGLPATAIVCGAIALERRLGRQMPRWGLALGDASYSIYLVHGFALPAAGLILQSLGAGSHAIWLGMILSVALSTLFGLLVYRWVELPIMHWFKGRRRTAIPAVA